MEPKIRNVYSLDINKICSYKICSPSPQPGFVKLVPPPSQDFQLKKAKKVARQRLNLKKLRNFGNYLMVKPLGKWRGWGIVFAIKNNILYFFQFFGSKSRYKIHQDLEIFELIILGRHIKSWERATLKIVLKNAKSFVASPFYIFC